MRPPVQQPKQHHYVHRAYLDGFVDPYFAAQGDSYLWAYLPQKKPFRQRPDRIAKRNYYYCFDRDNCRSFEVEHTLQGLEDISLPVLRKCRSLTFDLDPEERLTLAGYLALSYARVPKFENRVNRFTLLREASKVERFASDMEKLRAFAMEESERTGKSVTAEGMHRKLTGGSVVLSQPNRGWSLGQMIQEMMLKQKVVFQMCWNFLIAPKDDPGFITSDNPVSVFSLKQVDPWSDPEMYLTFPLCREVCLLASPQARAYQTLTRVTAAKVREVNKGTIIQADTQLYAAFASAKVQFLHDAFVAIRGKPKRILVRKGKIVEE